MMDYAQGNAMTSMGLLNPAPHKNTDRTSGYSDESLALKRDAAPRHESLHTPCADAANGDIADIDAELPADPRIAAALPAELIQPDEIVILLIKPSMWYIVLGSLASLTGIVLVTMLLIILEQRFVLGWSERNILAIGFTLIAARLIWQTLEWLSRVYVLTDRRIVRVKGVLRVQVFECALQRVQHTYTLFTIRERIFGLGTIGFATAGTSTIEAGWEMVNQPLEVHRKIIQTLNRYR